MSAWDDQDRQRTPRPAPFDFDAQWDAEKALRQREDSYRTTLERQSAPTSALRERTTPQQRRTPQRGQQTRRPTGKRRKRRKKNIRGWLILIALALAALLVLSGLIYLVVGAILPESAPPETTTEPTESTTPREEIIAGLIERGDRLAAGYDYDAAVEVLSEYGADWMQQPELSEANDRYLAEKAKTVRWADTTQITHIFFHSLIVDTDRAFDDEYTANGYNQYMATVAEFRAILNELYRRGYVLVRIHDIAVPTTDESGNTVYTQGEIYLPPGKTPIVLSQDDVNYYEYMVDGDEDRVPDAQGDGFANKLVIGTDGHPTCAYVRANGETVYGEYDVVPILEAFIEEHPDFSYRGARGILALTGYEGVFGYHTHPEWEGILGKDAYQQEIRDAQAVTKCLKEHGWEIASHSYAHFGYGNHGSDEVASDVQKWENQVQPVVGDTDIFIYPYGRDIAGVEKYSGAKFEALYNAGYRFFCNVDSTKYWVQIHDNYVRQGRRNIDGYRMWWDPELLDDLFEVEKIFDPARPTPVPSIV